MSPLNIAKEGLSILKEALLFFWVDGSLLPVMPSVNVVLTVLFLFPQAMWSIHLANQHFLIYNVALFSKCQCKVPFNQKLHGCLSYAVECWLCVLLKEENTDYPQRKGYFVFIIIIYYCFLLPFLCNCKLMNRMVFGNGNTFVTDLYTVYSIGKVGGGFLMRDLLFNNHEKMHKNEKTILHFYIPSY